MRRRSRHADGRARTTDEPSRPSMVRNDPREQRPDPWPRRDLAGNAVAAVCQYLGHGIGDLAPVHRDRPPDLGPCGRDRGVGHAGRGREGEGPQGGRPAGHRLRRRRARLPHPAAGGGRGDRGVLGPEEPPLLPRRRAPRAARRDRDEDGAGLGLAGRGAPGARHQRRQAGRVRGLRDADRPGRRGPAARAVLDDLPRGRAHGRRRAGRSSAPTSPPTSCRPSRPSRPRARRTPRRCCGARRRTPRARSRRARSSRPSGAGPPSTASG